ncbi:MAG TPA: hypothetical protein IAB79_02825 [Candidatus Faecousia excrementipullorum]|nr:hypothetical protein [Candidatus Faecousia excrementipullorum]
MQHLKKRMLALVLVTAMVLGLAPAFALPALTSAACLAVAAVKIRKFTNHS